MLCSAISVLHAFKMRVFGDMVEPLLESAKIAETLIQPGRFFAKEQRQADRAMAHNLH